MDNNNLKNDNVQTTNVYTSNKSFKLPNIINYFFNCVYCILCIVIIFFSCYYSCNKQGEIKTCNIAELLLHILAACYCFPCYIIYFILRLITQELNFNCVTSVPT
jgi:hypothetical protein